MTRPSRRYPSDYADPEEPYDDPEPDDGYEDLDESSPPAPTSSRRGAASRRARPAPALSGGLSLLAGVMLLVGACSGLATGGEAAMHASALGSGGRGASMSYSFSAGSKTAKIPVQAQGMTGLLQTGIVARVFYVLACLAAAVFAGLLLAKHQGLDARRLLAWSAGALAGLRIVLGGLDYVLIERSMAVARQQMQRTTGYSYAKMGAALSQAEDMGTTGMLVLAVGVAIFWIVGAVAFWETSDS